MKKNSSLSTLLKSYERLLWYPSAGKDFRVFDVFGKEKLGRILDSEEKCPDCFVLTDHDVSCSKEMYVIKGAAKNGWDSEIIYRSADCTVTAFDPCRIKDINVGYDPGMVCGYPDGKTPELYGSVYAADILIEYNNGKKYISKLIYAVAENTCFVYDFLLKNRVKTKYLVRCRYGCGFGGGRSTGMFLQHLLKDLGVKYFADDMNTGGDESRDVANVRLTAEQFETAPKLSRVINLSKEFGFGGYDEVILYRVEAFS